MFISRYNGEPIWVTAEKKKLKTAPIFWVGSEAPIDCFYPSNWKSFNGSVPYEERVNWALDYLREDKNPSLIGLYVEVVDKYGHKYGPDNYEMVN